MKIVIPGKPIAKARPRFARRGKFVTTYSEQQTEESKFYMLAAAQVKNQLQGPLGVMYRFFMPRPKGHYGSGKNSGKLKPSAPEHPITKPDLDNMEKFVADVLNGLAWKDDSQVVRSRSAKMYSENPRTEIIIEVLN